MLRQVSTRSATSDVAVSLPSDADGCKHPRNEPDTAVERMLLHGIARPFGSARIPCGARLAALAFPVCRPGRCGPGDGGRPVGGGLLLAPPLALVAPRCNALGKRARPTRGRRCGVPGVRLAGARHGAGRLRAAAGRAGGGRGRAAHRQGARLRPGPHSRHWEPKRRRACRVLPRLRLRLRRRRAHREGQRPRRLRLRLLHVARLGRR